eukprot:4814236-Alexandrium_andersonii.AAC.1
MSASLVGSEMCIRDSLKTDPTPTLESTWRRPIAACCCGRMASAISRLVAQHAVQACSLAGSSTAASVLLAPSLMQVPKCAHRRSVS